MKGIGIPRTGGLRLSSNLAHLEALAGAGFAPGNDTVAAGRAVAFSEKVQPTQRERGLPRPLVGELMWCG
jgi:hypothetical protein